MASGATSTAVGLTDDQMSEILKKGSGPAQQAPVVQPKGQPVTTKPPAPQAGLTDAQMAAMLPQNVQAAKPDAKPTPTGVSPKGAQSTLPEGVTEWKGAGGQRLRMHQDLSDPFMLADQESFAKTGKHITASSTYRSTAEQQVQYDKYAPQGKRVAKPGHSLHEKGRAIDVKDWKQAEPYLKQAGFVNPFKDDPNHFVLAEDNPYAKGKTETAVRKAAFGAIPGGPIIDEALPSSKEMAKKVAPYSKVVTPMAGATIGGMLAAPANLVAPGVAEVAGTSLGFGAGVQADRALRKYAGLEDPETAGEQMYGKTAGPIMDAGADVAMMAGLGPLMGAMKPGMNVLNNPLVKEQAGAASGAIGRKLLSEETKVPITPAQEGQARSTTYLEAQLRKNMWSADEAAAFDIEQQKALQDYAQKVQKTKLGGRNDPISSGESAKDSAWERIKAFRNRGGKLYDKIPVKPDTPIETNGMASAATEHLDELGKMESPTIKRILGIAQKSETPATVETSVENHPRGWTVDSRGNKYPQVNTTETPAKPAYTWQELRSDISELGKMASKEKDYNKKRIYNDLVRGANNDIAAFAETVEDPEIAKQLKLANNYWRHGDSIFGPVRTGVDFPGMQTFGRKQIKRLLNEESPEKIGRSFFKASPNASDIRALREASGEKAFNEIRQSWFQDMITKGEDQSFSHNRFITAYDKYKISGNLDEMLTKSQREGIDKLYEISRLVSWSEKMAGNPSGTGHMVINELGKWMTHPVWSFTNAIGSKKLAQSYFNNPEFQKKMVAGLRLPSASPKARVIAGQLSKILATEERQEER